MSKVALLILFNHKYEKNLDKLRKIYSSRFIHLYFIMPFYRGNDKDIICVYGNSYFFQGYIAQALCKIMDESFDHYFIIGDDLILNPSINQDNYKDFFQLKEGVGFIPEIFLLHNDLNLRKHMKKTPFWEWNHSAINFDLNAKGIEVKNELPSIEEATAKLASHGYNLYPYLKWNQLSCFSPDLGGSIKSWGDFKHTVKLAIKWALLSIKLTVKKYRKIRYPMIGSYSDIVIIPKTAAKSFAHYSGVFSSLNLFVEIAIPTALVLATDRIVQERDLNCEGCTIWKDDERVMLEKKFNNCINNLSNNFPGKTLYIHPVKLSKWK